MIGTVALVLTLAGADPRPVLVELQLDGRYQEALTRAEQELAGRPETARQLGLDYLRGHLLDLLGRPHEAVEAFGTAMAVSPELALYSRYRMAREHERRGHPEVAAGLVATVVASAPSSPLTSEATRLFFRTLRSGGDCRLLKGVSPARLPARERRLMQLASADCAVETGERELARTLYVGLIEEDTRDEAAREATERLTSFVIDGRLALLLGMAFHQHREFALALEYLRRAFTSGGSGSERERFEGRYAVARSHFWEERYGAAAAVFGELARRAEEPEDRARVLYQQGRSYELQGLWDPAVAAFRLAYLSSPDGEWSAASLLSALRLEWRVGREVDALELLAVLASRHEWREQAARAALFLSSSDVARRRADRAGAWLTVAERGSDDDRLEATYWRGRTAELRGDRTAAVKAYVEAMRQDLFHPLSESAAARLAVVPLAGAAAAEGRRLAASSQPQDLYAAWLLLGEEHPMGRTARGKLLALLTADQAASPFLRLAAVPVRKWPLWQGSLDRPEEVLLALGIWHEGAPAVAEHFPASVPSLALTGSRLMARAGETSRAMSLAGAIATRTPERVPPPLQPVELHRLLYPLAHRDRLLAEAEARGSDPWLLAAVIREESRFDPTALSPAAARGLTQFVLPTARRIAGELQMGPLTPEDLYRPEVSIALGAAYLAELLRQFDGAPHVAVAAYNAGVPQARLWRSYCASPEPEEYLSKVGFKETRGYLRKVLTSWAHYRHLYGES